MAAVCSFVGMDLLGLSVLSLARSLGELEFVSNFSGLRDGGGRGTLPFTRQHVSR